MNSNAQETIEDTSRTDWLVMWDMNGLETVFNLTDLKREKEEWSKQKVLAVLKEEKFDRKEPTIPLKHLILRARFNEHRFCEIYIFSSTEDICEKQDIESWFDDNPQHAVDWIRKNGHKIFGEGRGKTSVIS